MDWRALTSSLRALAIARGSTVTEAADVAQVAILRALERGADDVEAYAVRCVSTGLGMRRHRSREALTAEGVTDGVTSSDQLEVVLAKEAWFAISTSPCDVSAARCSMPQDGPSSGRERMARSRARRIARDALAALRGTSGGVPSPPPGFKSGPGVGSTGEAPRRSGSPPKKFPDTEAERVE